MDINALAGIISGISNMMQNNVETIDVPSSQIMGRWYQVIIVIFVLIWQYLYAFL